MEYKISEVAELAGVSVRTLHHYDQIGLLAPKKSTSAGYRLYSGHDLERLQQVLFFKELGFRLEEIKEILDSPNFDRKKALLAQKELLTAKKKRLEAIIDSVDQTLISLEGGKEMSSEKMFKPFDMKAIEDHQKKYAEETKEKYGHTDAYKQSQKRTANYTKDDWARISAKSNAIYEKLASLMDQPVDDPNVQEAIGEWRELITESFYDCTLEIFRGLGELYVTDQRFTKNIDKYKPGLAAFMNKAMHAYCDSAQE